MAYRILLVEDHEMNRDMLTRRLTKLGYEMMVAVDGQEAVDMAGEKRPDLILMDMSLPVMDGWEATRRVRANPDELVNRVPIIALTAHIQAYDRAKALEAGCNEYETKPIDLKQLTGKMEALLESRQRAN